MSSDDIVTRLRDYSARGAVFATNDMCWEAADEIERLRAALDADVKVGNGMIATPTTKTFINELIGLLAWAEQTMTVEESITALQAYDMERKRLDRLQAFPKTYREGRYR